MYQLLIIIGIIIGILQAIKLFKESQKTKRIKDFTKEQYKNSSNEQPATTIYSQKKYYKNQSILTENERIFYNILRSIISLDDHIILCKVRMEDVIHVDFNLKNKDFAEYQRARGKMKNRHFDFVICDSKNQEIQRVIELDGWTHQKLKEAEADQFKDEACKEAGVKIVRIDYNDMNYRDVIVNKILNA